MRRVNYFLTVEQIDLIEALASRAGLDRSTIIRASIERYLDTEERRKKESKPC